MNLKAFRLWFLILLPLPLLAQQTDTFALVLDTTFYQEVKQPKELRILSWNIKMLPRLVLRVREGQIRRTKALIPLMEKDQIDLIVFQECFDARVRRILKRRMKAHFPYIVGPANPNPFKLRTNSGVMMFSRVPIKHLGEVDFEDCEGSDCYARKGALLVEAKHEGHTFQVLGTHLEAGGPREIKLHQYAEIKALIDAHRQEGVPQFLCGDFNTHKSGKRKLYDKMIAHLEAEDGELLSKFKHTTGPSDMRGAHKQAKWEVIDYVLYRGNGKVLKSMERHVRIYRETWSGKHSDLSDHYAVLAKVVF